MNNKAASLTPEQALAELEARYEASVTALRKAIGDYIDHNTLPDTEARAEGLFVYPQLSVSWDGADHKALKTRAWGRFTHAGCYTTTITNPKLFRAYLLEQATEAGDAEEVTRIRDALLSQCKGLTAQDITIVEVK